jgi:hypothetical protein
MFYNNIYINIFISKILFFNSQSIAMPNKQFEIVAYIPTPRIK